MTMQTFTPLEYIKIDVASNFGLDKEDWDVRLDWFDTHEAEILQMLTDVRAGKHNAQIKILRDASEPALFFAGAKAYEQALRGEDISYPISLDATASGAQLLAILIGCEKSARLCNVIDTGHREDLYTNGYKGMLSRAQDSAKLTRSQTKQAIMTALYGSKRQPKKAFGEGPMLDIFYKTMEEDMPGIWNLNQTLISLWQPDVLKHSWILPDGFHVHVKVMAKHTDTVHFLNHPNEVTYMVNQPTEDGLSLGANSIHSVDGMVVREMTGRCMYNPERIAEVSETIAFASGTKPMRDDTENCKMVKHLWMLAEMSGFLSVRILDYIEGNSIHMIPIDGWKKIHALIQSLPKKPFNILAVHDCFRCHANYGNDLRRQYNEVLAQIADSNLLNFMATQITRRVVNINRGPSLAQHVKVANYALS